MNHALIYFCNIVISIPLRRAITSRFKLSIVTVSGPLLVITIDIAPSIDSYICGYKISHAMCSHKNKIIYDKVLHKQFRFYFIIIKKKRVIIFWVLNCFIIYQYLIFLQFLCDTIFFSITSFLIKNVHWNKTEAFKKISELI